MDFSGGVTAGGRLAPGQPVSAEISLTNLTDERKEAVLYLAAYDNNGGLQALGSERQTLYGQGAGTILSATVETWADTCQAKAFLWDGNSCLPFGEAAILRK